MYIQKIRDLIEEKRITQKEFSEMIGKNVNTISNYFTEKTKIDVDTLLKIAEVLDVNVNFFFGNETLNETQKENLVKEIINIELNELDKINNLFESYISTAEQINENIKSKALANGIITQQEYKKITERETAENHNDIKLIYKKISKNQDYKLINTTKYGYIKLFKDEKTKKRFLNDFKILKFCLEKKWNILDLDDFLQKFEKFEIQKNKK